jgi:inorganic triphosphatase YgiF
LEIEQKFEVDEDFKRPDFGALPGVTAAAPVVYHLDATYFDTPGDPGDPGDRGDRGGRLLASKITLRRRTGGTDEGWHLKLPADAGARHEFQEPLGDSRDEVPERLASRVAEVAGGLPLAPIVVLDTERTVVTLTGPDGREVAEVADDVVTARRLAGEHAGHSRHWREIEVEVPEREPELQRAAADLLLAAGARPATYPSKLARALSG